MTKSEKIRLAYAIFLGVFTLAVGIAIICVAADIYYSGKGTEVIYSRAIVGERLKALAIPLIILIAAVVFGAVFPLYEVKAKRRPEDTLKKLAARLPESGSGDEYDKARQAYKKAGIVRLVAWLAAIAVTLAAAIAILCYLLNTAHFASDDITKDIFDMVNNILPWSAAALLALVAAAVCNGIFAERQVNDAKTLIKNGSGKRVQSEPAVIAKLKTIWANPITVWAVRGAVLCFAVAFIIAGIVNGGASAVLIKAINICTECIGLG